MWVLSICHDVSWRVLTKSEIELLSDLRDKLKDLENEKTHSLHWRIKLRDTSPLQKTYGSIIDTKIKWYSIWSKVYKNQHDLWEFADKWSREEIYVIIEVMPWEDYLLKISDVTEITHYVILDHEKTQRAKRISDEMLSRIMQLIEEEESITM